MTDTELREKARAVAARCYGNKLSEIEEVVAAAMKAVAEEAVSARPAICAFCSWEGPASTTLEQIQAHSAACEHHPLAKKLSAYESATPESPEVKEAMEVFEEEADLGLSSTRVMGKVLYRAYRSTLVRIKELEADVAANTYTQGMVESALAKLAEAEKKLSECRCWKDEHCPLHSVGIAIVEAKLASAKAFHRNICDLAGWSHDEKDWLRDLACVEESLRSKLAYLSAPVGDEEEREALQSWAHDWRQNVDPMGHKWFCRFCQIGTDTKLSDVCSGKYQVIKRSLRAKTAALKEAEAKLAARLTERVAQIQAHRAVGGIEHDPANSKFHGNCVVCVRDWPCEYAGQPPATDAWLARHDAEILRPWREAVKYMKHLGGCSTHYYGPRENECSCGFDVLKQALLSTAPEKRTK